MGCKFCKFEWLDEYDRREEQRKRNEHPNNSGHELEPVTPRIDNRRNPIDVNFRKTADVNAFNSHFIDQRQRASNNRPYQSIIELWNPTSLQQLTKLIQSFAQGKLIVDQHWIIFYWIAHNIAFDTVSYFSKNYADQTAEGVFRNRKGVCAGYANLYKYLCDALQLPCEVVRGYAKGYGFDDREGALAEVDHAWNAVQIYGHWYLIESTWGAGHLNDQKIFRRELHSYYFLPRPEEMIYHHLPQDEQWQLLRKPIRMEQYLQMPQIRYTFFELNLEIIKPKNQYSIQLEQDKPYALVVLKVPNDVYLTAALKLNGENIEGGHRIIPNRVKQQISCYFAPSSLGKHKISIYGKRENASTGTFKSVLNLELDIRIPIDTPISYPKTWDIFTDYELKILSPLRTHVIHLNNDEKFVQILIRTPSNVQLIGELQNENDIRIPYGDRVYYDHAKDFWRCKFAPNANGQFNVLILAKKKSDSLNYTSAVSFKIIANQILLPPFSFPKTWQLFYDLHLRILSPLGQGIITLDETISFAEIHVKAPADVCLIGKFRSETNDDIPDGQQVYYDKRKDFWICRFAPNQIGSFEAMIFAKKTADKSSYSSVAVFQIEATRIQTPPLTFPETYAAFYDYDLRIKSPRSSSSVVWPQDKSYAEVQIQAPDDVQLSGQIQYKNLQIQNGCLTQYIHDKRRWQLLFAPERFGRHELIVYAKRTAEQSSTMVVKFQLDVTSLQSSIKFPMIYPQFYASKCQIYTPIGGPLPSNSTVLIHCFIPNAEDIQIAIDSKNFPVQNYENSIVKQTITVGSSDVTIYAKNPSDTHYTGLIQYSVQ